MAQVWVIAFLVLVNAQMTCFPCRCIGKTVICGNQDWLLLNRETRREVKRLYLEEKTPPEDVVKLYPNLDTLYVNSIPTWTRVSVFSTTS